MHAATRIEDASRDRLGPLTRYVARPALSLGRLEVEDDRNVRWTFERLVALVLHPRVHGWTYFGSLAPAASIRDLFAPRAVSVQAHARFSCMPWAELLRQTFGVDVLHCPRCGGRRHWIAAITRGEALDRILEHAGIDPEPERPFHLVLHPSLGSRSDRRLS